MKLVIKSFSTALDENRKAVIRDKFLWFDKKLANNAELTIGVEERITKKSNEAHQITVHLFIPGLKNPIYLKSFDDKFITAVDKARDRLERVVLKDKDKGKFKFKLRFPRLRRKKEEV